MSDVVPLAVNDVGLENVASAQGVIWLDYKVALYPVKRHLIITVLKTQLISENVIDAMQRSSRTLICTFHLYNLQQCYGQNANFLKRRFHPTCTYIFFLSK